MKEEGEGEYRENKMEEEEEEEGGRRESGRGKRRETKEINNKEHEIISIFLSEVSLFVCLLDRVLVPIGRKRQSDLQMAEKY